MTSQLFASTCTSLHGGLSVDEGSVTSVPHRLSLSGEYLPPRLPGGSPSLRHVTRMGQSIANEDTKSAQGSRLSIPGSKTSIQGSRPSVFSSQTSFLQSGSRSQMFSPTLSIDPMPSGSGNHRDDDTVSLPLSGRTTSPLLQQSSLNSSLEAPTRDEPSVRAPPLATSHDLGPGMKDFASMTCIPNHSALSAEVHTTRGTNFDPKPDILTDSGSSRRTSLNTCDLGALTTISGRKVSSASEPAGTSEQETMVEKMNEREPEKKSKSKMSRLEMLTSLRASMRKAAMRMSFKGKKKKENVVLTNDRAVSEQETTPTRDKSVRRHSDNSDQPISPGDTRGRQRAYTDFSQLSQPNLYYPPQPYHMINYPQLSQSYGFPPPMQVPLDNPFGRPGPRPPQDYSTPYPGMVTPDYSDVTTPEHGRYGNQNGVSTPETFLQQDVSPSDDYPQSTSPNEFQRATSPTVSNRSSDVRSPDHDRFHDAGSTSDPYRVHSPLGYGGKPLPTVHERYRFNGYPDDLPNLDMFSGAPPYASDVFTSPRRRGDGLEYPAGGMYPPPPMPGYPGAMHNGIPNPYFEGSRRTSLDHTYDRDNTVGTFHKRRSSSDKTGEPFHPRQGSYEQAPGEFPHPRHYHHPRHGSRDYEQDGYMSHSTNVDKRQSGISEASSDLSTSRTRVSWNLEVIEHIRTPSDGSDFDLNQL